MSRRQILFGLSVLFLLALLGACRQGPVVPPPDPLDFATAPSILRGRWEGIGVSDRYRAAAFGLNGALFGAGTREGYTVWETSDGTPGGDVRFTLPTARPETAAFSPDGGLLAFHDARTLRLLSAETGEVLAAVSADTLYGDLPVFSSDGSRLLVKQGEKRQLLRLERTDDALELIPGPLLAAAEPDVSYAAAFSPDSTLALVSDNTGVTLWRVADGTLLRRYTTGHAYSSVTFSPDGSLFLGGTDDVRHLSVTGELLREFTAADGFGYSPVVSPDGRYLLSSDYGLFLWDVASGELLTDFTSPPHALYSRSPAAVSFGASGDTLYTASSSGEVQVRDLPRGGGEVGQVRELFRTESFTLTLDLTAAYLDTSGYGVSGTFVFDDEPEKPLAGDVCVPEKLKPQTLAPQTSPAECNANFSVGEAANPEWRVTGSAPFGTPLVTVLDVSRGDDTYRFELRRPE